MSFPRYERYKDTGVEWLGVVPEHWCVHALYSLGKEREESNTGLIENNLLSLSYGRIIRKDIETSEGLLPDSFETYQVISPGDIIFRLTDLQNDKRSLRTAIVKERGIITFAYTAFQPLAISPDYLNYLFRDYDLRKIFYSMGGGVRQSMKFADIKRLPTLAPSSNEQNQIVAFLNHETAKIDTLITEQERLIELLTEKRQAVISHAVTKGLNPDVPVKGSGVDWLSEIPSHWTGVPLGYLVRFNSGGTPSKANEKYWDGDIPWVSPKDMKVVKISDAEDHVTELALIESNIRLIEPGHILVVVRGMILLHSFPVARNLVPVTINQDMKALKCCDKLLPGFLQYLFMGVAKLLVSFAGESAHGTKKMETSVLSALQIPLPPIEEQQAISIWLDDKLDAFDSLLDTSTDAIRLLEQRRSAVISAAVTGKIDVRNYTPKESA